MMSISHVVHAADKQFLSLLRVSVSVDFFCVGGNEGPSSPVRGRSVVGRSLTSSVVLF